MRGIAHYYIITALLQIILKEDIELKHVKVVTQDIPIHGHITKLNLLALKPFSDL